METLTTSNLAATCGGVIGWDREIKQRPAGLRTHMLVALGAAGFTLLATDLVERHPSSDPSRMLEGIIGGVGFLGAGTILRRRGDVEGMTTAAGLWVVAAMGMAAGLGEYHVLAALVLIAVVTLSVLYRLAPDPGEPPSDRERARPLARRRRTSR